MHVILKHLFGCCRCGNQTQNIPCKDVGRKSGRVTCNKACRKQRSCGRHKCGRKVLLFFYCIVCTLYARYYSSVIIYFTSKNVLIFLLKNRIFLLKNRIYFNPHLMIPTLLQFQMNDEMSMQTRPR